MVITGCTSVNDGSTTTIDLGGDAGRIEIPAGDPEDQELNDSTDTAGTDTAGTGTEAESDGPDLRSVTDSPVPPTDATPAVADWIFDGDSLDITFDTIPEGESSRYAEVRLIGVNAPEGTECAGDLAKDALIDRLGREDILVLGDRYDEFGRLLAFVWHDNELINLWLVENGLAVARSSFGHAYDDELDGAEARAQAGQRGIWSPAACGAPSDAVVVITELHFDAEGPDNENPNGEWIELTNLDTAPVDLQGWVLRDESTRHRYEFGPIALGPDQSILVRSGCGTDTTSELYWCDSDGSIWSNSGDTAFVYDSNNALVDSFSYDSIYD